MEREFMRRMVFAFAILANLVGAADMYEEALAILNLAIQAQRLLMQPYRGRKKGVEQVQDWSLDNYSEEQCYVCVARLNVASLHARFSVALPILVHRLFRFHKADLPLLLQELNLPLDDDGNVIAYGGCSFEPMELLCLFLCRMSHASTWDRIVYLLGSTSSTRCKKGYYFMLHHICDNFKHCIDDISRWQGHCEEWASAVHDTVGAPAPRCIGFIDTVGPCARPRKRQEFFHAGYKKLRGLKFQSIVAPNGLIVDLFGPCPARRRDSYMLGQSKFLDRMEALCRAESSIYYVYGDLAYSLCPYVLRGFKGAMAPAQAQFSKEMNAVRSSVEWEFQQVIADWGYVNYKPNLKDVKQSIGTMYYVAALLTNMKICVTAAHPCDGFGCKTAKKFKCRPPSLHEYLHA